MELETLVEHGDGSAQLRALLANSEGRLGEVHHDTFPAEVDPLGDAVQAYHSLSLEQLRDRMPSGTFGSCGRCRQTTSSTTPCCNGQPGKRSRPAPGVRYGAFILPC